MIHGNIHSIETFGTVDGPGIRFVVFVQGCPMRCLYCHNPDTWSAENNTLMSSDEILAQYSAGIDFYKNGGITVTGGEPLRQLDFILDLFSKANNYSLPAGFVCGKNGGIHTTLDTSGIMFPSELDFEKSSAGIMAEVAEKYKKLCSVTDLVLLDIKHIDNAEHKKLTGHSNENILAFARYLSNNSVDMIIRHVLVPGINDSKKYLCELAKFISTLKTVKGIDILPYHTMGKVKYEKLGIEYPLGNLPAATKDDVARAKKILKGAL